jgi:NSS family neurotransmitter:Na+ symporter
MSKKDNNSIGFKTNLGAVLAAVGSAVGLGNIWRFPYKMGTEGGSLFLLGYILITLLVCLPLLISEFVIGRAGGSSNIKSFNKLKPNSMWWLVGLLGVLTATMIVCFYNLIGGWISYYIVSSFGAKLTSGTDFSLYFENFISDPFVPLVFLAIFTLITALTISRGIQKGIEKFNLILLPMFGIFMFGLMLYSFTLPNTMQSMRYIFIPDFSLLSKTTFIAILAQAFFSMSVGLGVMVLYGSYMKKTDNLVKNAIQTTLVSAVGFALISSILIFNIIFAYGLDVSAGPKLLFVVLPQVFADMKFGFIVAPIFFILVFVAAFTSAISLFEVPTAFLISHFKLSRNQAVIVVSIFVMILGGLSSLSLSGHVVPYEKSVISISILVAIMVIGSVLLYSPAKNYFMYHHSFEEVNAKKYSLLALLSFSIVAYVFFDFNVGKGIFDILDTTTEQIMIPLGGILGAIFLSMVMNRSIVKEELNISNHNSRLFKSYIVFNKYVIPFIVLIVMAYTFI